MEKVRTLANVRKEIQRMLDFERELLRKNCPSRIFNPDLAYNILHWNVRRLDFRRDIGAERPPAAIDLL